MKRRLSSSRSHVNYYLTMGRRDMSHLDVFARAWANALSDGKLQLEDLSMVETHDCFTMAELMEYEAMGLTKPGEGARALKEGWTEKDGKLPVNPSGGLKSKGHPIGATGVSMHVLAAMQLQGEADEIDGAELVGTFNMGGPALQTMSASPLK